MESFQPSGFDYVHKKDSAQALDRLRLYCPVAGTLCYHRGEGGEETKALGSRGSRAVLTGVAGGTFSGLTGVGGGAVMVPLLTGQLRLTQHRAHGTSLAIITFIAIAGVIGYWRAGNIDWGLALTLAPGAVAGVYIGARAMVKVPALQLRLLFAAFLFFVAFRQLVWNVSTESVQSGGTGLMIELAFGFAGGLLAGVLGVGGGAIFVPAIVIFGLAGAGNGDDLQKVAQGVSLVVIIFTGVFGTVTNMGQDTIDVDVVKAVTPPAVLTAFLAALFANNLDDDLLRRIYGLTALLLGLQITYTSIRAMAAGRPSEHAAPVEQRT